MDQILKKRIELVNHGYGLFHLGYHALLKQCQNMSELANASDQQLVKPLLTFDHENFSVRSCLLSLHLSLDAQQINEQVK